jgi:hypothetical protein
MVSYCSICFNLQEGAHGTQWIQISQLAMVAMIKTERNELCSSSLQTVTLLTELPQLSYNMVMSDMMTSRTDLHLHIITMKAT